MSEPETLILLRDCRVGHIAFVDAANRPYVIPLRFVHHNNTLYVRLAFDGRKQEAIEHSRRVCFEADDCADDFSSYASVLAEGTLIDVFNDDEKRDALIAMNHKYECLAGIPHPGANPVIHGVALRKIIIDKLSGRKREPDPPAAPLRIRTSALLRK